MEGVWPVPSSEPPLALPPPDSHFLGPGASVSSLQGHSSHLITLLGQNVPGLGPPGEQVQGQLWVPQPGTES